MTRADTRWVVPEWGSRWVMALLLKIAQRVGRRRSAVLLWPISVYCLLAHRQARRASRAYLRRVLPRAPGTLDVLRHFHAFAQAILDRAFFLLGSGDMPEIRVKGQEVFLDTLAAGRGCLLLGAHIGSFEAMRAIGHAHGVRMRMLMYRDNLGGATAALEALAPGYAEAILPIGPPETMLRVADALAHGEAVGILGDRAARTGRTVSASLLGDPVDFPEGPFRLALVTRTPLLLAQALRQDDGTYEVHFEALGLDMPDAGEDRAAFTHAAAVRYAGWMDRTCRAHPFAWFNFYDYWKDLT